MRLAISAMLMLWMASVGLCQVNEHPARLNVSEMCSNCSTNEKRIVGNITLSGNLLTKNYILLRELEFRKGDTLSSHDFCLLTEKSRQNLLNRSLFNFVTIDTTPDLFRPQVLNLKISVIERWYIWPLPIFELSERNFNSWWETKDFRRANYGMFLTYNNFRGRMEVLKSLIRLGYNQNYFIQYEIPYVTKKQNLGIGFQLGSSLSREIPYLTVNNRQLFYRHQTGYAYKEKYARAKFSFRQGLYNFHQLNVGYEKVDFADTIAQLNPNFLRYHKSSYQMLRIHYTFKSDHRDSKPYPLKGRYFDVELDIKGLGLLQNETSFTSLKTTFDFYRPISKRWFGAFSTTFKTSSGNIHSYWLQRGLGYHNDFVRSFELNVIDGMAFGLFKSNVKYALIHPKVRTLPILKQERFSKIHYASYINLLFDAGYVYTADPKNSLQNKLLFGTGIGVDVVAYYDLVWRFEYTVNQFGKPGFFIHFVAPI